MSIEPNTSLRLYVHNNQTNPIPQDSVIVGDDREILGRPGNMYLSHNLQAIDTKF